MPHVRTGRRVHLDGRGGRVRNNSPELAKSHSTILPRNKLTHGHSTTAALPKWSTHRRVLPLPELRVRGQQDLLNVRLRPMERRRSPSRLLTRPGLPESPRSRRRTITTRTENPEETDASRERLPGQRRPTQAAQKSTVSSCQQQQHPTITTENSHSEKVKIRMEQPEQAQKPLRLVGFCKKCREVGFGYLLHGVGPFLCYRCADEMAKNNPAPTRAATYFYTFTTSNSTTSNLDNSRSDTT